MRAVAIGCVVGLLALGCRGEPPVPPPTELVVGAEPVSVLDPLIASADGTSGEVLALRQVFEGLVSYDPQTLRPRPALAASWSVSSDARTFTFLLRRGARFHSGDPVTADDVVWSLNRLARSACAPPEAAVAVAPAFLLSAIVGYPQVAGACQIAELPGLVALSNDTVMVSLSQPWADFLAVLGHPATSVVPADTPEEDLARVPVGTGPFRVSGPPDGGSLVLHRFEDYWGAQPELETVRMRGYADHGLAYLDLLQEKLHYAPVPLSRVRQARRDYGQDGFALGAGVNFFGVNLRSERMQPHAFRQGLSLAVDREALATAIFENTREPASGLASPAIPGVGRGICGDLCEHDLDGARRLIAEAYPEGPPEVVIGVPAEGTNPAVGEAVADMFAQAGVTARVVERDLAEHVAGLEAGDVDMFQFGWIPSYPTLDGLLWPLFRSTSPDNHMRYSNREVDELLTAGRGTLEDAERIRTLRQAEERILADVPVIPLLWYRSSIAADPRLRSQEDVMVDGLGLTSFASLGFE